MRFGKLALVFLFVVTASAGQAENILQNPGFESGMLAPWTQARNVGLLFENWNVTNAASHSGNFSATAIGEIELRQDFAPIATSNITEVSFWAAHDDKNVSSLAYDLFYIGGDHDEYYVNTSGTDFNQFDVTANLRAGAMLSGFSVFGNSDARTYVDDVVINTAAVPELSTFLVFGSFVALGGLVTFRQRKQARQVA